VKFFSIITLKVALCILKLLSKIRIRSLTLIREIEITNFRGISYLKWWPNPGINCLIGPGDSGKSTILDAIELCLGSRQNFTFNDADFHFCRTDSPIIIDVTLGELNEELLNLEVYGHFLRGRDITSGQLYNETGAQLETVLTLRLIVRDDLEPQWLMFSPEQAAEERERNIQWKHRQKIAPVRLGAFAGHHLALGQRSILGKLSDSATDASAALASASRQARQAFAERGCDGIEPILQTSQRVANDLGISVGEVKALLDMRSALLSGGAISLHDDDQVPLKSLGSGSSRLLVAGLQKEVGNSSIFVVDEIEFGLEPYRIVRLLDSLGAKQNDQSQQVFLTTHSPVVLRELQAAQLFRVRSQVELHPVAAAMGALPQPPRKIVRTDIFHLGNTDEAQKTLRACAEAFLAPKVVVCEGKTEIGILRGKDLYEQDQNRASILARGCHWADGGGGTMVQRAKIFARMGYQTALFMDSDVPQPPEMFADLAQCGVQVFRWGEGLSTETAIFSAVPDAQVPALLEIACDWRTEDSVNAGIQNQSDNRCNLDMCRNNFADAMRPILGAAAGRGKWFKDIEPAEEAFRYVLSPNWQHVGGQLSGPVNLLWNWISPAEAPVAPVPHPQNDMFR
jgi:hypothetical protein